MKETLMGLVVFAVVVGIRIAWVLLRSKRRKQALSELAQQLGWVSTGKGVKLAPTPCFCGRTNQQVENVIEGSVSGLRAFMFDYHYDEEVSGPEEGNTTVTRTRTIAAFFSPEHQLPGFVLKKKSVVSKAPDRIEMPSQSEFFKRLVLTGKDKPSVSSLFDPQLVNFLSSTHHNEKLCLEGAEAWLVFYYQDVFGRGKCLAPKQWRGFLQETSQIAAGFFQIAAKAAPPRAVSA